MSEAEPDLDQMARQVHNLFKFRNFYDHVGFNPDQCLAITKGIIHLTNSSKGYDLGKKLPRGRRKFEDDAVVFHDEEKQILSGYNSRHLYVKVFVSGCQQNFNTLRHNSLIIEINTKSGQFDIF